jgi:hypothetical protein
VLLTSDSGVGDVFDGEPVIVSLEVLALLAGGLVLVAASSRLWTAEAPGIRVSVNFMIANAASPTINSTLTNARIAVLLLVVRRLTKAPVGLKCAGVS